MELEKSAINAKIEQYDLQLEGYALDDRIRDADIDKLLKETDQKSILSSIQQVDQLSEGDSKTQLKLILSENANLHVKIILLQKEIELYRNNINDKDLSILNLKSKISSFILQKDRENNNINQ